MTEFSVLVVDDEADFVDILLMRLRRKGVSCEGAHCGRDAIGRIRTQRFDVVLLDMKLGDMSGNEVLQEIKRVAPETEVVILSGHASAQTAREGLGYGAFDYLIKPVEFDSLYDKLREGFNRQTGPARTGRRQNI